MHFLVKLYVLAYHFPSLYNFRKREDNTHEGTTWQIKFELSGVNQGTTYKLRVAIASATLAELQVNSPHTDPNGM